MDQHIRDWKRQLPGLPMFRILLWKAYFDKGFSVLNYLRYPLLIIGFGSTLIHFSVFWILFFSFIYAGVCFLVGKLWFKYHLINTETEIQNIFNPFCREVREKLEKAKL